MLGMALTTLCDIGWIEIPHCGEPLT
jgi:hypothetical protein